MKPSTGSSTEVLHAIRKELGRSVQPVSVYEAELRELEKHLGIGLPEDYRQFLGEFGFVDWPEIVYGVDRSLRPGDTLLKTIERERNLLLPALPPHLIPFSPNGLGSHYCLDLESKRHNSSRVVYWRHEVLEGQVPEHAFDSFSAWLAETTLEALHHSESRPIELNSGPGPESMRLPGEIVTFAPSRRGTPPYDRQGFRIELHPVGPYPQGPVLELTQTVHRGPETYLTYHHQ